MWAAAGIAAIIAVAAVVIVGELAMRRQLRRALDAEERRDQTHHAFGVLLAARSRFTHAVSVYEEARVAAVVSTPATAGGAATDPTPDAAALDPVLVEAERAKDAARGELLDAQRLWAASRESDADRPEPTPTLWTGRGVLVGGNLGPIGWERATIRLTHLLDDDCWAIVRISRPRLGLGFGAEVQRLAIAGAGVDAAGLRSLVGVAFSGPEVAARPGFAPARTLRRLRRTEPTRSSLTSQLRGASMGRVLDPRDAELSAEMLATFEAEFGHALERGMDLGLDRGLLGIHTRGPSLLLGAWSGPKPRIRVELASPHRGWNPDA